MKSSIFLISLLLLVSLTQQAFREVLFGPLPLDYRHHRALVAIAENLLKDPTYRCSVVVHDFDIHFWRHTNCALYPWGDQVPLVKIKKQYEEARGLSLFNRVKEEVMNSAHYLDAYIESDLIQRLSNYHFDLIICDHTSIPCLVTGAILKIERTIHFSPTCPAPWASAFQSHPSYIPSPDATMDTQMTFKQRTLNLIYDHANHIRDNLIVIMVGADLIRKGYLGYLTKLLKTRDELYMAQCVTGFNYPEYHPPNVIDIGPLFARSPQELETDPLNFMEKHEKIIYFGVQGLEECVEFSYLIEAFKKHPHIGFVIASDYYKGYPFDYTYPYNLYYLPSTYANDILGHPKTFASITYGDWEMILQSLYHGIPVISIGHSFDRGTNGKLLEYQEAGIFMPNECDIASERFFENIDKLISYPYYGRNAWRISKLIQQNNANETIKEWTDYYFDHGVSELVVRDYAHKWSIRFDRVFIVFEPFFIIGIGSIVFYFLVKRIQKELKEFFRSNQEIY